MSRLPLLSLNAKLAKSVAQHGHEILTAGLFLAPHKQSGRNVCPMAGACSQVCVLWFSGRTVTQPVRDAMLRRTKLCHDHPELFLEQLRSEIGKLHAKAYRHKKRLFIRLNGSSDLRFDQVAEWFPDVEFYDYTKRPDIVKRVLSDRSGWPSNYAITYSWSERVDRGLAERYLQAGHNVSVVFDTEYCPQHGRIGQLPGYAMLDGFSEFYPVVDGDKHDLRHPDFDGRGNIVGLRFKGSRKRMQAAIDAGFVLSAEPVAAVLA